MICTLTLHILLTAESDAYYYNYVMYIYILMLDVLIIMYLNCVHAVSYTHLTLPTICSV